MYERVGRDSIEEGLLEGQDKAEGEHEGGEGEGEVCEGSDDSRALRRGHLRRRQVQRLRTRQGVLYAEHYTHVHTCIVFCFPLLILF